MTKITISGDLPLWFLAQANRLVKVMNEILQEDLNVLYSSSGELFLMTDDELGIKPCMVENEPINR